MLLIIFIILYHINYCECKYQQSEKLWLSVQTDFNFSNIHSQFRVQTKNDDDIMKIIHFKHNEFTMNLLSISAINKTVFLSKTIKLPYPISDLRYFGQNDEFIVAALSSKQIAVINDKTTFLDLKVCLPTAVSTTTHDNAVPIIIGCSAHSISTINIMNITNSNPLKWYIHPITDINYNKNDITNIFIDNDARFAYISFNDGSSAKFDINKRQFIQKQIPYSFVNYFKLNDDKDLLVSKNSKNNKTLLLLEITNKTNEFKLNEFKLNGPKHQHTGTNVSLLTSSSCYNNILIGYYDYNNYYHIDIDNFGSLLKIKTIPNTKTSVVVSNSFLYLFNNKSFINIYDLSPCHRARKLQESPVDISDTLVNRNALHAVTPPAGLIPFYDNLATASSIGWSNDNCGAQRVKYFEITDINGVDLSFFVVPSEWNIIPLNPYSFNIYVYSDDGTGRVGDLLEYRTEITTFDGPDTAGTIHDTTITLNCSIFLPQGEYWISFQPRLDNEVADFKWNHNSDGEGIWSRSIYTYTVSDWTGPGLGATMAVYGVVHTGPVPAPCPASESICEWVAENGGCVANDPCDDELTCTLDICDESIGCIHTPSPTLCDDNIDCTIDTCTSEGCAHIGNCDDDIACTLDSCTAIGCIHTPSPTLCDDNIDCTLDICVDEGCVNAPLNAMCKDDDVCTENCCEADIGCVYTEIQGCSTSTHSTPTHSPPSSDSSDE